MKLGLPPIGCFTRIRHEEEDLPPTLDFRIKNETGHV